jgi:hypothetical protein
VLGSDYRLILADHGVTHVYNYLYAIPSLQDQHEKLGEQFSAPFVVFRLLTQRDKKYHDAVKAYEPYDKLLQPLPDMREQTVKLVKHAIAEHRRAYVLVNNRTEGNAPQTTKPCMRDCGRSAYRPDFSTSARTRSHWLRVHHRRTECRRCRTFLP